MPRPSHATAERYRHADGNVDIAPNSIVGERKGEHVEMLRDWPLAVLHRKGVITKRQHDAGAKFYGLWYGAGLCPWPASSDWHFVRAENGRGTSLDATEHKAHCRRRFNASVKLLPSRVHRYVSAVVLHEWPLVGIGKMVTGRTADGQARAAAVEGLVIGLDILADHYGLPLD